MRLGAALLVFLALAGCRDAPDYPVPEQSPNFDNFKTHTSRIVDMSDPGASNRFARDILDSSGPWRWALQRPAVKLAIGLRTDLNYVIDFTLPEVTFKQTGPVTIAFTVNDRVLDRIRYSRPGNKHFEKSIPPGWIESGKDATVGAEIDKMWVSPHGDRRLGFIISRIGLTEP